MSACRIPTVVAQVAVSLLLLVGAGLATRSVEAARSAYPGFDPSHVTAIALDVQQNGYDEARGRVFYRQLLEGARADAGVEFATLAAYTPLGFLDTPGRRVAIEGYEPRRGEDLSFMWNSVAFDYFRTLHIPVMAGREFEDRDDETAAHVAIVNQTLAQRFWGGAPGAIGKRVRVGDGDWRTVIGGRRRACGQRLLTSVLFGVSATDAISFARALALVLGVVIVATIVPAWRAARTNPLTALRHQ
jgi:putative ABC transport system permease protein